jgi:hypothetical protein
MQIRGDSALSRNPMILMAERTGLEFVCADRGISNLLIPKDVPVPLNPLGTPLLPPTGAIKIGRPVEIAAWFRPSIAPYRLAVLVTTFRAR